MKVIICKVATERAARKRLPKIVNREKRRSGCIRVFCASDSLQRMLAAAGISSEVLDDFRCSTGVLDEFSWQKVYELSDQIRSSAENDNSLKYSGINVLTFESTIIEYVYAAKFSRLCRSMAEQKVETLLLVLDEPFGSWLRDIRSKSIRTVRVSNPLVRFGFRMLNKGLSLAGRIRTSLRQHGSRIGTIPVPTGVKSQLRVLFIVSMPLYAKPMLAIFEECRRNGLAPFIATDDPTILPLLEQAQVDYWFKPRFTISPATLVARRRKVLKLTRRLRQHVSSFDDRQRDEFSDERLCWQTLLLNLPGLCKEAVADIDFASQLMERVKPDILCLMPQSEFAQEMAWLVAKQRFGIPVVAVSAAWETADARAFRRHLHADKIAVMGENIKKLYVESGVAPDRVAATGIAHFDLLFNRNWEHDDELLRAWGIDPSKRIMLFGTENFPATETLEDLHPVIDSVLKMGDVQLVVKVHPREYPAPYQAAAEKYHDSRIIVSRDIDLYALLSRCELVIVKYSTVALEAMMIDKSVISINLSGQQVPVPYVEEGAALGVFKVEEIEPAIQKALYDEETRARLKTGRAKFVRAWAGEPDGRASERIVNLMKTMIDESKARKGKHETNQN